VTFVIENYLKQNPGSLESLPAAQARVIQETLTYASSLNQYPNPDAITAAHALTDKFELTEWELAVINNCKIDDVDECLSLVPSIRKKVEENVIDKDKLEEAFRELKRFQNQ